MKKQPTGFVLPVVVISGMVLLIILAYSLQTVSVSRETLNNQHMQLLARQAAESGLARAQQCVQKANQIITWTESKPLKPNTDCYGNVISSMPKYIIDNSDYRSQFEVRPSDMTDDFRSASSIGKTEVMRKNGATGATSVARQYRYVLSSYIRTGLTFDDIAFGSVFLKVVGDQAASVYFQTKSVAGLVAGAGHNYLGSVLTGVPETHVDPSLNPQKHRGKIYKDGVDLPVSKLPSKVGRLITNFQGSGWNTYLLLQDGSVYVTGPGYHGHKGNGLIQSHNKWPEESKMNLYDDIGKQNIAVRDIVGGGAYTFIISQDGKLYGMGADVHSYNSPWDLGYGTIGCYRHSRCRNDNFAGVEVYSPQFWGRRMWPLNYPSPARWVLQPTRVGTETADLENVSVVSADILYNMNDIIGCAIGNENKTSTDRKVYCWGSNRWAQIANKRTISVSGYHPDSVPYAYAIYDDQSDKPIDVKTDSATVYVLTEKGRVFARGDNRYRQIGPVNASGCVGHTNDYYNRYWCNLKEIKFEEGVKIKKMVADSFFVLFLDEDGNVWSSGNNNAWQLGIGNNKTTHDSPQKVGFPEGVKIVDFAVGSPGKTDAEYDVYRNSLFIDTNGDVWGAGSNIYGQLGIGNRHNQNEILKLCPDVYSNNIASRVFMQDYVGKPVKMCLAEKKQDGRIEIHKAKVGGVKVGLGTTVVITNKNKVFTVGNNHQGQLGAGDTTNRSIPAAHRLTNRWEVWYY